MTDIKVVNRRIDDLVPYARNARTHSPEQVKQIEGSLAEFGWTNPVLVGPNNVVIAGHARLQAAANLRDNERGRIPGWPDKHLVPTIDLSRLTETQRRAYVLADNRLALNSGWDSEMLKLEASELDALGVDLQTLGFDEGDIDGILDRLDSADDDAEPPEEFAEYDEDIETEHECPRCGYVFSGGSVSSRRAGHADDEADDGQ